MTRLFISYRRADTRAVAGRIDDRLRARYGRASVFIDVDVIPLGADFRQHIQAAVGQCDVLLALIGKQWLETSQRGTKRIANPRDPVRVEIEAALLRKTPAGKLGSDPGNAVSPHCRIALSSLKPKDATAKADLKIVVANHAEAGGKSDPKALTVV